MHEKLGCFVDPGVGSNLQEILWSVCLCHFVNCSGILCRGSYFIPRVEDRILRNRDVKKGHTSTCDPRARNRKAGKRD